MKEMWRKLLSSAWKPTIINPCWWLSSEEVHKKLETYFLAEQTIYVPFTMETLTADNLSGYSDIDRLMSYSLTVPEDEMDFCHWLNA